MQHWIIRIYVAFPFYSAIYAQETDEFSSRRHRTGGRHCHHHPCCRHRCIAQTLLWSTRFFGTWLLWNRISPSHSRVFYFNLRTNHAAGLQELWASSRSCHELVENYLILFSFLWIVFVMIRFGLILFDLNLFDLISFHLIEFIWFDLTWFDLIWFIMICLNCFGMIRFML